MNPFAVERKQNSFGMALCVYGWSANREPRHALLRCESGQIVGNRKLGLWLTPNRSWAAP
jgi:hypothetical protein